ncbi:uncharacterized protein LOC131243552 [Magnolia sinica]|uniref:uncharacterized protein LOC131243552 n=1 Tax=Magnolia sinica TaxID=86752 RepID=UPI002659FE4A|nr:uncharacterized protein LOC131243552 [Magnolia sinica]XP_058098972.1 uncharacterized protein LOC131243552 [Magnolia sinica]XP_058098973.1 uncharacterized protein LOC131243552 [Magnolia sinica]XP_058098974.1 uncharacterized protein LOC131243552 [Magnolia sinica]
MPVSEELGVAFLGRQSSDSFAGVPIKKRRFPFLRSPSPSQIPSSPHGEPDRLQNEQSISVPELSRMPVSEISVNTKRYSLEDGGGYSADRNLKLLSSNATSLGLHLQHSTGTASAGEEMNNEKKNIPEDPLVFQRVPEKTELLLALKEPFGEENFMPNDKPAFQGASGNTELQLGLGEPSGLPVEGQNNGGSSQEQEKLHQNSLVASESCFGAHEGKLKGLALAEEEDNVHHAQSNAGCTPLPAERSQWDLNTMMETWDDPSSHSGMNHPANGTDGLDLGSMCDQKSVIGPKDTGLKEQEGTCSKHSPVESKSDIKLSSSTTLPDEDHNFKARLLKQLSPPLCLLASLSQGPASESSKLNSMGKASVLNLSGQPMPSMSNVKLVGLKPVKSEPLEVGSLGGCKTVERCILNLVNQRTPKPEPFDGTGRLGIRIPHPSRLKSIDSRAVKSELLEESRQECPKAVEGISSQLELHSYASEMPINGEVAPTSENVVKTSGLESVGPDGQELVVSDQMVDTAQMTSSEGADSKSSKSISDELHVHSSVNDGVAEGYRDENVNKSGDILVDDPPTHELESVVSQNAVGMMSMVGKQQSDEYDYEDGEVREPLVHNTIEGISDVGNAGNIDHEHSDVKEADDSGIPRDDCATISSHIEGGESKTEVPCETSDHCIGGDDSAPSSEKKDQGNSAVPSTEVETVASGKKRPGKATRRIPRVCSKGIETMPDPSVGESQETVTDDGQGDSKNQREKVKEHNPVEASQANIPKMQPCVTGEEANKDVHGKGNRSRIINLARADDGSSSGRPRSNPVRSLPSRTGKEKFPDRGDKLHPRGSRDEICMDGFRKFDRERNQNQSVGKSESVFLPVRGRIDNWSDALGDSNRDYASEQYPITTDFQLPRHKKATAFAATKDSFVPPDGAMVNAARAGGKPKNDDIQSFRHLQLRRQSPGGRDGPMPLGMQMVRLPLRDTSPDRCIGGGGPEMVLLRQAGGREGPMPLGVQMPRRSLRDISPERCIGGDGPGMIVLKHQENFIRGMPDMMDPLFTRRRPQYPRLENPFIRRERSLSPIQRRRSLRGPQGSSRSPPRSRSPCQGSPPRRRSPAGFDGRAELMHGRPPQIFRVERMRPPHGHPCFPENVMGRRHGSPPFMSRLSNDIRDAGPPREHERRLLIRRSPSGRVTRRSTRRLEMIDPRERMEGDEFFVASHSGRGHELADDECVDERRKCNEGRGLVRPFRPCDIGADAEAFAYHAENGSRPGRICPEDDAEFRDRAVSRDFDRHIKFRLGNPRRPRSIEEQEENYGHGGPGWHDPNYDGIRLKKRRL